MQKFLAFFSAKNISTDNSELDFFEKDYAFEKIILLHCMNFK